MSLTIQNFLSWMANYCAANFPVQLVFLLCGITAMFFLFHRNFEKHLIIGALISFLWIWIVVVYHILYFNSFDAGALICGILFLTQGVFLFLETFKDKNLIFTFKYNIRSFLAYFFIIYGLILYPLIGLTLEGNFSAVLTLGLSTPIVILTFGFLMLTNKRFPKYLLFIPSVWALIGSAAAINFGMYQDVVMLPAAVFANLFLLQKTISTQTDIVSFRY